MVGFLESCSRSSRFQALKRQQLAMNPLRGVGQAVSDQVPALGNAGARIPVSPCDH
jgi:hypothetical protein